MTPEHLRSCLESWLRTRYGTHAALNARSLDRRAHASLPSDEAFVWLSIGAGAANAPARVGIRALPNSNDHRDFEFLECFSNQKIRRSFWRLDIFDAWQRAVDI